jgi:hypothetical protein
MRIIIKSLDLSLYLGSVDPSRKFDRSVENALLSFRRKRRRPFFMIDPGVFALDVIFNKVCVLVTAAFVLRLVPGFRRARLSLLLVRDRGTALVVFLVLGLVEEAAVGRTGWWLDMSISDDGQGVPAAEVERVFFAKHPQMRALGLLRQRLQALFGRSFKLEVISEIGQGTTIILRIPVRRRLGITRKSSERVTSDPGQLQLC